MITYKPSSRLGTLNEELFTSDPTSRGWVESKTVTGSASTAYDGTKGYKISCPVNSSISTYLENTNIKLQQYLSVRFPNTALRYTAPVLRLYLDDVQVFAYTLGHNTDATMNCFGQINVFKNTANDWKIDFTYGTYASISYESHTTYDLNKNVVSKIKLGFTGMYIGSSGSTLDFYTTDLRWV